MFRNLTMFRVAKSSYDQLSMLVENLDEATRECALNPVGPMDLSSRGFVPFNPSAAEGELPYVLGSVIFLTVGGEDKILPSSSVNAELQKRLDKIESAEGRKLGGRARKRLKEDIVAEMLPRALVRPYRLDGFIDTERGLVVVNTASRRQAEAWVSEVRHALGSFPALPLNAEVSPRSVMTGWIAENAPADGFDLGDECELRDAADHGAIVRCKNQDLAGEEINAHLESGKQVTRLGVSMGDNVSFLLCEDLVLRKFKLLDGAMDKLDQGAEREDIAAEINARAALLAGEVGAVFDALHPILKISRAEG